jgi:hypothetical protein
MELNPNHQVTRAVHDQWHKLCALLMAKFQTTHVVISLADIRLLSGKSNITVRELDDGIHLELVDDATAERLVRKEGGRPA